MLIESSIDHLALHCEDVFAKAKRNGTTAALIIAHAPAVPDDIISNAPSQPTRHGNKLVFFSSDAQSAEKACDAIRGYFRQRARVELLHFGAVTYCSDLDLPFKQEQLPYGTLSVTTALYKLQEATNKKKDLLFKDLAELVAE